VSRSQKKEQQEDFSSFLSGPEAPLPPGVLIMSGEYPHPSLFPTRFFVHTTPQRHTRTRALLERGLACRPRTRPSLALRVRQVSSRRVSQKVSQGTLLVSSGTRTRAATPVDPGESLLRTRKDPRMKKKQNVRQWLILTVLLALCAVAGVALRPVAPAAHAASDTSCSWHIDSENDVTYPTLTGTRITGYYTYQISVSTLRNNASSAYCGRVATGVCLWTHSDNHAVDGLDLFLTNYVNGTLTGDTIRHHFVPKYGAEDGPFCAYSGGFAVSSGSSVLAMGEFTNFGSLVTQQPTTSDLIR